MSLHLAKLFSGPLALASAALALHIGAAAAADSTGDIQQQTRALLSGTTPTHFVAQSAPRDAKVTSPAADSQEFVKRLLLGRAAYRVEGAESIKHFEVAGATGKTQPQQRIVVHGDLQVAVRQDLLGQHPDPSSRRSTSSNSKSVF